jgi:uncharacterized protein (TIGR04255 family)
MFEPISDFTIVDYGLFWSLIKDEFPAVETQPPMDNAIEKFGTPPGRPEIQLRLMSGDMLPRCFFRREDNTEILQLQRDRLTFNWLSSDGGRYPRHEQTVARFRDLFERFEKFAAERGLEQPRVNQCEIVNVNIVPIEDFGEDYAAVEGVFVGTSPLAKLDFLPIESHIVNTQHVILSDDEPRGRLYAARSNVIRIEDSSKAFRYELTARGAPIGTGVEGVLNFFELARSAINTAFMVATTDKAKDLWGLSDVDGNTAH